MPLSAAGLIAPPPTPTLTPIPYPEPDPTVTPISPAPIPDSASVAVVGWAQRRSLSCEAHAAVVWANFWGMTIDEMMFFAGLPISDNPNMGFVGDVNGAWGQVPPADYGVHAEPVAAHLRQYGLSAYADRYATWEMIQRELAAGRPAIVWVTGHVEAGTYTFYQTLSGEFVRVAPFEHVVLVTGYTADTVTILDGPTSYTRALSQFLLSWAMLENMAILAQ
jgi:uncharacterized protein YvpB